MKTANRPVVTGACLLAFAFTLTPATTYAADPSVPSPAPVATASAPSIIPPAPAAPGSVSATPGPGAAVVASASPLPPADIAAPKAEAPTIDISSGDLPLPGATSAKKKGGKDKEDNSVDNKIPDSVKDVIKNLNAKTDDVTLDDLNAARQAVAKLDALIEIEKRLADLEKIRQEREANNNKAMMAAIPASALAPPGGGLNPQPVARQGMPMMMRPRQRRNRPYRRKQQSLRRIYQGRRFYPHRCMLAIVWMTAASSLSISPQGVEVERGQSAHLTRVKDVQAVFGEAP